MRRDRTRGARRERIALQLGREESASGISPQLVINVRKVGSDGKSRVREVLLGVPVGGRISKNPAVDVAYRILKALRPPDKMPELRRRLRELRGE